MTPGEYLALLGLIQQVLALLTQMNGEDAQQALETYPFAIQTRAGQIILDLTNSTYGLDAIINAVFAVRLDTASPHVGTVTDVLDAIAAMPLVTLPETPPPGYGPEGGGYAWPTTIDVAQMCSLD